MRLSSAIPYFLSALLALSCKADTAAPIRSAADVNGPTADVTVFITGNTLGQLKPCGCSGGQLGGFDRRNPILHKVPADRRLIVDTGNFITKTDEQDLIKYTIIMQALAMCDYDVVNLTKQDAQVGTSSGLLESAGFKLLSAEKTAAAQQMFSKRFGSKCIINVAAANPDNLIDNLRSIAPERYVGENDIKILIVNGPKTPEMEKLQGLVDVIIVQAHDTDEPGVLSAPQKRPLIISAGNRGKYVGRLDIKCDANSAAVMSYTALPVSENLPIDQSLADLYKVYQSMVKDANLLEKYPKLELPKGLQYIGSNNCGRKDCHEYEYSQWKTKKHAIAMESLKKVGSDHDPECVVCHVVGMEYKTGFISPEKEKPDVELNNVGCEACHGPGLQHVLKYKTVKTPAGKDSKNSCTKCHTPEQSPNFSANEQEYRKKIVHWREPNLPGTVKQ